MEENIVLEFDVNLQNEQIQYRKNICLSCNFYAKSKQTQHNVINAETGEDETIILDTHEVCKYNDTSLYLITYSHTTCPKGDW